MTKIAISGSIVVFFLVLALTCVSCAQQPDNESPVESFKKFWSEFREAVLAGDTDKIASMARFPFMTRGILDSDPIKTHDRISFLSIIDHLLDQDPGLSREPETMRSLIERTKIVTSKHLGNGGKTARVGVFVFQKIERNWQFTQAYIEE